MMDKVKHMPKIQELLNAANEVLGWNILEKCSVGATDLENTVYAQPIMFVAGLAHAELMKQKYPTLFTKVKAVAGFSLGEITALCYAGAISLVDGLKMVKARAEAMERCNGGVMCNVVGLPLHRVKSLCKKTGCTIANIICNHEEKDFEKYNIFVCSGTSTEVTSLVNAVQLVEGAMAKKLKVSGAFHSSHMLRAQ